MKLSDFDYELPPERIAQRPCAARDRARLLVHEIGADRTRHRHVADLPELLRPGDVLVLNDARVLAARLFARRASGGRVELFFLEEVEGSRAWRALVNPARKLKAGELLEVEGGKLRARMVERPLEGGRPSATWLVELFEPGAESREATVTLLERHGRVPLPPYVRRSPADDDAARRDRERYQTVFARVPGAVAAPTAGLHFTPELFGALESRGVERAFVTLHVGPGTFRPVEPEALAARRLHAERFELPADAARLIEAARRRGGRVVAVGTTSARTLEASADADGRLVPGSGSTELFLAPGSRFRAVDALVTNFHLPRSSLLMLVSALAGRERVLRLYREAIELGYRFYSYGDAMLLLP